MDLARHADTIFDTKYLSRAWVTLSEMSQMYARKPLDKGPVRISNWEANPLIEEQQTCT